MDNSHIGHIQKRLGIPLLSKNPTKTIWENKQFLGDEFQGALRGRGEDPLTLDPK